jgi:hypothetical protein
MTSLEPTSTDTDAIARELVIRTERTDVQPLDAYVTLLGDYVECQKSMEFWQKRLERLKAQLAAVMGEKEVGTVNGEAVFFYQTQNRFRTTEFAKKYPDFHRLYSRDFTEKRFDPGWLKDERPELYEEFQVRAMRITFDA